ncbi:MAG: DUF1282 domain-containing protein [Ruminococcaceae bacterium]|nr:DUF1282 domain-containing protein [Oscillospiraceae bacterium]
MKYLKLAILCIFHPTDFYEELKTRSDTISVFSGAIIMLLVILMRYLYVITVHIPLADIRVEDTNVILEIGRILLPMITISVSVYAVTSILYGETTLKMVFLSISYAFVPFILLTPVSIILSRFLGLNEAVYFNALSSAMWLWIVLLAFFAIMIMNNFGFFKTIGICILSIILTVLIWAIAVIIIALSFQIIGFVREIVKEYILQNL